MNKFLGNLPVLLALLGFIAFLVDAPFLRFLKGDRVLGWWFVILFPFVLFVVQLAVWIGRRETRPFGGRLRRPLPRGTEGTLLAVGLFLEACAGGGGGNRDVRLEGTTWEAVRIGDDAVETTDRGPYLTFETEAPRVSGIGGCNQFGGAYRLEGEDLTFSDIVSTKMACPTVMHVETGFFAALERARRWRPVGSDIELLDEAGRPLLRLQPR